MTFKLSRFDKQILKIKNLFFVEYNEPKKASWIIRRVNERQRPIKPTHNALFRQSDRQKMEVEKARV